MTASSHGPLRAAVRVLFSAPRTLANVAERGASLGARRPSASMSRKIPRGFLILPEQIEDHRDHHWRREETRRVESAAQAEAFVEQAGFAACLTDSRRPGPSLYVAVCGRRDAVLPRHVQKDPETSLTWALKDELLRRGRVYYGKAGRAKALFIAPRLVPCFHALFGMTRAREAKQLSRDARALLRVLRREWEMGTADLRADSGVTDRARFTKALDELQRAMLVVPSEAVYEPTFTYLWTVAVGRFGEALTKRVPRDRALREIARAFLTAAGMTLPGELARAIGVSRPEAGLANRALVADGFAISPSRGVYQLAKR